MRRGWDGCPNDDRGFDGGVSALGDRISGDLEAEIEFRAVGVGQVALDDGVQAAKVGWQHVVLRRIQ